MNENEKDEFFEEPAPAAPSAAPSAPPAKKTALRVAAILGGIFIAVAAFLAGWFGYYYSIDEEIRSYLWAKSVTEQNYYQDVSEDELYSRMFDSLGLDPYTEFYTPEEYAAYRAEGAGSNSGVGISFFTKDSEDALPHIFQVPENSPAGRAGLRKGMYIVGYGESADSLQAGTMGEFREFVGKQKIGAAFVVRCGYREDGSDAENYELARIAYQSGYVHYRDSESSFRFRGTGSTLSLEETHEPLAGLGADTAYIRLDEFSGEPGKENAADEFEDCLKTMKARGRENLVLDLRSNGGGRLDLLVEICSHLLRNAAGAPVVMTATYRNGKTTSYRCSKNDFSEYFTQDSRVYVLADEYTASASECLIGALVDYGTTEYGDIFLRKQEDGTAKTFGKGIMQSQFISAQGAAMKLTVATVSWPVSGKCIHGVGVTEADGANAIPAPLVWGEDDGFLGEVLSRIR